MGAPFISGFTIVRNAVKYDYPIAESIRSILPVVDEYVVAVGKSDDGTLELIRGIDSPKIRIIETVWDDSLRTGGKVLADQTNISMDSVSPAATWCFYLQGDEVVHEADQQAILSACHAYEKAQGVEGLLFKYKHFYGSYGYIGDSRRWYRNEVRIVRNDRRIRSYRDAQGFRKDGRKLNVKSIDACIYHYGWVKDPGFQQAKQEQFHKMWHDDSWVKEHVSEADHYDYQNIDSLRPFEGTHPSVMKERLSRMSWVFRFDTNKKKFSLKGWLLYHFERFTGIRLFEYKNYKRL